MCCNSIVANQCNWIQSYAIIKIKIYYDSDWYKEGKFNITVSRYWFFLLFFFWSNSCVYLYLFNFKNLENCLLQQIIQSLQSQSIDISFSDWCLLHHVRMQLQIQYFSNFDHFTWDTLVSQSLSHVCNVIISYSINDNLKIPANFRQCWEPTHNLLHEVSFVQCCCWYWYLVWIGRVLYQIFIDYYFYFFFFPFFFPDEMWVWIFI